MSEARTEEFEQIVAAHIELGSTHEEAVALAQAHVKKSEKTSSPPVADSAVAMRRQRKVRRSVRVLALGVLPAVLLYNAFIYRFDYGWGYWFLLAGWLPGLLGFRQGFLNGTGTAKAWAKESAKVIPHLAVIYLLWSLTQGFREQLFVVCFLTVLHGTMALIAGSLSALIGGALRGNHKAQKVKISA